MTLTLGNITLREDMQNGMLLFDMVGNCGTHRWVNCARVHEPGSVNPGLEVDKTCGIAGVQKMIVLLDLWREHVGLERSNATVGLDDPVMVS